MRILFTALPAHGHILPVSPDAPAPDRLLGFAGRSPDRTPTPVTAGG
ncbi:hypothetical protein [Streptomyces sp. NPDC059092]